MHPDDAEARRFIAENIDSVAQLELLLLIRTSPEQWWSAEGLARELRMEAPWMDSQLEALRVRRLCEKARDAPARYRFSPGSPALDAAVAAVARAYLLRRVSIIEAIYSKPSSSIRIFADAFKIKKERPDA